MKSNKTPHFERLIWKGMPPSNKAREAQLAQLCEFLGYEGSLESELSEGANRQLMLGNLEDYDPSWPRADSKSLYVGLFCDKYPHSADLLKSYEENQVTFYLNEKTDLQNLSEFLSDLLKRN
ncbi:MAG: hypothetical protein R3A80_09340 [Bdellovibrionota bacterium]